VATSAVSSGATRGIVVVVVSPVVTTAIIPAPVVVPASIVATAALVTSLWLRIISTTTLEAAFGALRPIKGLVDTNSPSIESIKISELCGWKR
jgi:hypothetical protein